MGRNYWLGAVPVLAVAVVVACSKQPTSPTSPSASGVATAHAGEGGETLKSTAPTPLSPINGVRPDVPELVLRVSNSTTPFMANVPLTYRFQVFDAGGAMVYDAGGIPGGSDGTTSHSVAAPLDAEQPHTWWARSEYQGAYGPWSSRASFIAPATTGYIRGNELYDPLINGTTIGTIHGPVTFIPGLGAKLESQLSYISYELQSTLFEGEFSILVTGMPTNTEGTKTKLFAMAEGYEDIVVNDRRMTVEKRGDPAGIVAWRFITHDDQVDTEGAEREYVEFHADRHYFWEATWRNNFFNLLIKDGGVSGSTIYSKGKHFAGRPYDPNPHVIYIGAPVGRTGPDGASVDQAIIRQVWVSSRPRPSFANK